MDIVKELLYTTAFCRANIDYLLNPENPSWIRFDPELGYEPDNISIKDGMDSCRSVYTYESSGQRKMVNYADQACRINTYGNSFTMCQQVSDGETWQEYLAAHIGEPIRNFGNGGYGVYQAYRRALRMEATDCSAEYIILGIFDDDHIRNIDAARWIRTRWHDRNRNFGKTAPMHGLPWSHLRFDLNKSYFVERPGHCKTEDDLRTLCDPERFYKTFKGDQIVRLFAIQIGGQVDNIDDLQAIAENFGIKVDLKNPEKRKEDARRLHVLYGLKSTEYLIGRMTSWIEARGKKLMVLLSYTKDAVNDFITGKQRFDQEFINYLDESKIPYLDLLSKHAADYKSFNLSLNEYFRRYYIHAAGAAVFEHYSPAGNFFTAMNIKDEIVNWLDPKPPAYEK